MENIINKRPIWQAETHNPETCEKLRQALRDVKDPELGLDIIQLGMVRDVEIKANQANIKMILTTPFCPFGPSMLDAAKNKAADSLGLPVEIEMTDEVWEMSMMEEGTSPDWGLYR
jgi:metal-sulfur cluster biosynthetic enzyme